MKKSFVAIFLAAGLLVGGVFLTDAATGPVNKHIFSKSKGSTQLQDGDIIFQSSKSGQSWAIQLATHSKYSHVGIIYVQDGNVNVLEAVQPVKITPLKEFVRHGDGGRYVVKRLKNADEVLTREAIEKFKEEGKDHLGKNYDIYFEWSDDLMYCSELVWKMYHEATGLELGERKPLKSYDLCHPEVKRIMRQRYGDEIPADELMISPGAIFESDLLETVVEK